jgi:hypothetical protein
MNFSERAMTVIVKIQEEKRLNFFEAASEFCEQEDIDPEDFAKKLDKVHLDRLQCCALEERMLQKKYVKTHIIN